MSHLRFLSSESNHRLTPGLPLVAGFVLLLCCAASAALLGWQSRAAFAWVQHTFEVGATLDEVQIHAMRAEINRRGFVLTGDEDQRRTYATSRDRALPAFRRLERMVADNPTQRGNVADLRARLDDRFANMAEAVRRRRAGDLAGAIALTGSPAGKRNTAAVVAALDRVRAAEQRLLVARQERAARLERLGLITGLASATLLIGLAAFVMRERRRQFADLERANDRLARDMRLRERAEAELALLAANATDAVLRVGRDGTCLYASPSAQEVFGVAPEVLIGQSLLSLVDPADRAAVRASLSRLLDGEVAREVVTCRQARRGAAQTDEMRWLEASTRAIAARPGEPPRGVIASVRDISARKRLELALEAARAHAEVATQAKSSFLANMSHEIRTPMNGVLGFVDLLLAASPTAEQRRYLDLMADSGRAMMRLLNDILDLAKIEAGQMRVSAEPTDLRHLLRRCTGLMAAVAEQKGVGMSLDIAPAIPMRLISDPLRLRQIVLNLLGNAVKFTAAGEIAVVASVEDDRLRVSVRDTGIGIADDRLETIFDEFAQAESNTARRYGGTGLGLSVSARLAGLMEGRLSVASTPGVGTVFTLDVPLRPADVPVALAVEPIPSLPPRALSGARVLIAEDHDINQILIVEVVRQLGLNATLVGDGAAAIAAVEAAAAAGQPFALVLMDMQMPVLDGLAATRRLRAAGVTPEALPIVALTANAFAEDVEACRAAGMQAHLAKPLRVEDLAATVSRWLRVAPAVPAPSISPALRARFAARTAATLDALERLARGEGGDPAEVLEQLHKLAGTAALFGQARLGTLAAEAEDGLPGWIGTGRHDLIRQTLDALRDAA
ncbi:ATP-binding protein [Sphingomonas sp. BK235]|uniref:hybrid sensor histidine kinase/response regulator n=1 Tax=Sphingomonas sp. BK235 TaxID=2512131 RepID=UPI001405145B|nr:ATP-binding protein [Sphingomonas sp. BK235]